MPPQCPVIVQSPSYLLGVEVAVAVAVGDGDDVQVLVRPGLRGRQPLQRPVQLALARALCLGKGGAELVAGLAHTPGSEPQDPDAGAPTLPPPALPVLTMTRVSSRWVRPPLRILLPLLTLFACCFCRHLRSWMLQGLKLLLGWSISSFSAETQTKRAQCHRAALGVAQPPRCPSLHSSTCTLRNNMQRFLADPTSLSLVPTRVTHSPGSILHWAELPAALGKTPGSFSYSLATTKSLLPCVCYCRVTNACCECWAVAVPLPATCHQVLAHWKLTMGHTDNELQDTPGAPKICLRGAAVAAGAPGRC